jgi:hypothetical protein
MQPFSSWDNTEGIVARLEAGQPTNHVLFPDRGKRKVSSAKHPKWL